MGSDERQRAGGVVGSDGRGSEELRAVIGGGQRVIGGGGGRRGGTAVGRGVGVVDSDRKGKELRAGGGWRIASNKREGVEEKGAPRAIRRAKELSYW